MKNLRQQKILELIKKYDINTQDSLIERLAEEGIEATQTTVSRDIRQLNLIKLQTSSGSYKYVSQENGYESKTPGHTSSLSEAVTKIEIAQNIVVVKTLAGMANAIAVCVENMHLSMLIGSVAGDDTILMVFKDIFSAARGEAELKKTFGR